MHPNLLQTALPAWHKTGCLGFSDEVIEADRSICARSEPPTIPARLGNIAFAISVLRGKLNRASLDHSHPQPVLEILQQSRILDQELMTWRLSVPREWETFSVISPHERRQPLEGGGSALASTWLGYTAFYPDPLIAKLMNQFRMHSISIKSIRIHCASWIAENRSAQHPAPDLPMLEDVVTDHDQSTQLEAQNAIQTLVDGICATVPFHLGEMGQNQSVGRDRSNEPLEQDSLVEKTRSASNESSSLMRGPRPPAGGFMLVQPLVVAYLAPGVPADQRRWILGKALEIAKYIGMDEEMVKKVLKNLASR